MLGKGYSPVDYALFCYGGGGPLHVAGYTAGIPYRDVLVPAWAAGFSAFGCACADLEYRSDLTIDFPIMPGADDEAKGQAVGFVQQSWEQLRGRVLDEFKKSSVAEDEIDFRFYVRMMYQGQLNDIEVFSPAQRLSSAADIDGLIEAFEDSYGKLYARSAKSPELGYLITNAIVTGAVSAEKPTLPSEELSSDEPTLKSTRPVWWTDDWEETSIYEQSELKAGQTVEGPAIVESPADTLAIPPGRQAYLDEHRIFHLRNA